VKEATPSNNQYSAELKDGANQNIYAPFSSELDWKFARWAKLRGPGSTSVTELMAIEGVCFISLTIAFLIRITHHWQLVERLGLSFKNSKELNKIIDESLPGRPAFKRHEVMVGNEVCEVFFRDVIACIRAYLAIQILMPSWFWFPKSTMSMKDRWLECTII
jgi:hypothetical protein